jgi:hypothetical protein
MDTQKRTRDERATIGLLAPSVETNFGWGEVHRRPAPFDPGS